jgi:release factor glutamine methyltransferase
LRIRDILSKDNRVPRLDLMGLVSHSLGLSREALFLGLDREIEEREAAQIDELVEERRAGRPLAYITRVKEFYSEEFFVDGHVLVPRPETERLVEEALRIIENRAKPVSVLDMGTGSGAIGIIMAKRAFCEVLCVDISPEALRVARQNARLLCPDADISFVCSSLFDSLRAGTRFDLVLANLPYIPTEEIDALAVDVREFEPRVALDGGPDGLGVYR